MTQTVQSESVIFKPKSVKFLRILSYQLEVHSPFLSCKLISYHSLYSNPIRAVRNTDQNTNYVRGAETGGEIYNL